MAKIFFSVALKLFQIDPRPFNAISTTADHVSQAKL